MPYYNEDDVASMTDAEIQEVFHTPDYQRFLTEVEARWECEVGAEISDDLLHELEQMVRQIECGSERVNWQSEGF